MKIILTKIGWNAKQNVKCSNQVDGKDKLYELMFSEFPRLFSRESELNQISIIHTKELEWKVKQNINII